MASRARVPKTTRPDLRHLRHKNNYHKVNYRRKKRPEGSAHSHLLIFYHLPQLIFPALLAGALVWHSSELMLRVGFALAAMAAWCWFAGWWHLYRHLRLTSAVYALFFLIYAALAVLMILHH